MPCPSRALRRFKAPLKWLFVAGRAWCCCVALMRKNGFCDSQYSSNNFFAMSHGPASRQKSTCLNSTSTQPVVQPTTHSCPSTALTFSTDSSIRPLRHPRRKYASHLSSGASSLLTSRLFLALSLATPSFSLSPQCLLSTLPSRPPVSR